MSNKNLFRTYIVASPSDAKEIEKIGKGGWRLSVKDDPSFRHWTTIDGTANAIFYEEKTSERIQMLKENHVLCQEVLVETTEEGTASNVASLIQAGTLLGYPDPLKTPKYRGAEKVDVTTEEFMRREPFSTRFTFQENALFGCKVAFSAWVEHTLCYAIEKYKLSFELDSFTPHSASPHYGQVFLNQNPEFSNHVYAATAVLVAYSVIDELELEIRSSQKKQRWNDKNSAMWNPKVKEDIDLRLQNKYVDLSDPVYWIYRGEPSSLELNINPQLGTLAEYADGKTIRDRKMGVPEAIHVASYIRNFVLAHKFSELVSDLGPYDVHNVQMLARRLILSSLELYKSK